MPPLRSVVLWGYTNSKWLWVPFAQKLKSAHGARIHVVCSGPESVAYWKQQDPAHVIDSFTTTNHFGEEYAQCDVVPEEVFAQARSNEERYECYLVDVLQTDRHLGRGFAAGGVRHPRSRLSDAATDVRSAHYFNRACAFWEEFFDRTKPDCCIGVASAVLGKTQAIVARRRGIPIRQLADPRYQSYFSWAVDEYDAIPAIARWYAELHDADIAALVTDAELEAMTRLPYAETFYRKMIAMRSLRTVARKILRQCRVFAYRWWNDVTTIGEYRFLEQIRGILRVRHDLRAFDRLPLADPRTLAGTSYVFFPLGTEPETTFGMFSPEMNEQLAAIEFLAKNLPAGTRLVVKEHLLAVGRRPRDFYRTILDIPNARMVPPTAVALNVARGARAVAVIASTLGMEAAVLGIPVISYGLHNHYNVMPHVHVVRSWMELRPLLAELCRTEFDPDALARRRADGRRYLAALKCAGFDWSWANYATKEREPATDREVETCYRALLESFVVSDRPHV